MLYLINYIKDFRCIGYQADIVELQNPISCHGITQFDTGIREIIEIDKSSVLMYTWRNCIKLNNAENNN